MGKNQRYRALKIRKVLVSQPEPTSPHSPYAKLIEQTGVEFTFRQFIEVEPVWAFEFRKQRVDFSKFSSVILNSKTSVDHFFRICEELRYQPPESLHYYCLSESIALYLQRYIVYRKRRIFFGPDGKLESLLDQMEKNKGERFVFPVSNVQKPDQIRMLRKAGFRVTKAVLYNTVSSNLADLEIGQYDLLVFYSPYGIKSLMVNFPDFQQGETAIAAYGKNTQGTARQIGLRVDIPVPTIANPSMTDALQRFISEANGGKE